MLDIASRVEDLVRDAVETQGLELVYVQYEPRGATPVLRIYLDKPGGISIADCSQMSRQIGAILDVEDVIPTHYLLEVSSPGIERPLFTEQDYIRFEGEEIRLVTRQKIEGRRKFKGRIVSFQNARLELESDEETFSIPFRLIKKANLIYDFEN